MYSFSVIGVSEQFPASIVYALSRQGKQKQDKRKYLEEVKVFCWPSVLPSLLKSPVYYFVLGVEHAHFTPPLFPELWSYNLCAC